MTDREQDALVAERVMGWRWVMKQTSHGYWTRTLLPVNQVSKYTPIWDGRDCDCVDVSYLNYFKPSTESKDALLVKDCMEKIHKFSCDIQYHTRLHTPWLVMFQQQQSFLVDGSGQTMQEAIVKAVLRDSIKEILEQMWV